MEKYKGMSNRQGKSGSEEQAGVLPQKTWRDDKRIFYGILAVLGAVIVGGVYVSQEYYLVHHIFDRVWQWVSALVSAICAFFFAFDEYHHQRHKREGEQQLKHEEQRRIFAAIVGGVVAVMVTYVVMFLAIQGWAVQLNAALEDEVFYSTECTVKKMGVAPPRFSFLPPRPTVFCRGKDRKLYDVPVSSLDPFQEGRRYMLQARKGFFGPLVMKRHPTTEEDVLLPTPLH